MKNTTARTLYIKEQAKLQGFNFCGISKAEFLHEEAFHLEQWLKRKYHGTMGYLEKNFDKRLDPTLLVPGAKSIVSLIYNYYPKQNLTKKDNPKIAKYAYGKDYHSIIKKKLKTFMATLLQEIGQISGRAFVDSAPVLEQAWAKKSGLGWRGKNGLLLNRAMGSFFFLAELIIDLHLDYDTPTKDYCGSCTACMDACPTQAIETPYVVNGSQCISYFTIELKENIPSKMVGKFEDWIFGCDICQDVCPWNRFSTPHQEYQFDPANELKEMKKHDWEELTEDVFKNLFAHSAVQRTGFKGLKRNIAFLKK